MRLSLDIYAHKTYKQELLIKLSLAGYLKLADQND